MIFYSPYLLIAASLSLASPLPQSRAISTAALVRIAPDTASCSGSPFPDECAPASIAAPAIQSSFERYNVTSFGTQAALVALMLYESGDFRYAQNHYPGIAGQGTRNMMSPTFVRKYAATVLAPNDFASSTAPATLLEQLNRDPQLSFGSAAWFLNAECSAEVRQDLASGTTDSWNAYLTSCVGTTPTDARTEIYKKIVALGGW